MPILKQEGLIKEYENKGISSYKPGCLDINKCGNPIDINGKVNIDFTFYGTPTEGITFDNDTLSRTRNDFASMWAKKVYDEALEKGIYQAPKAKKYVAKTNSKAEKSTEKVKKENNPFGW